MNDKEWATCTAIGEHHGDVCKGGRVQAPNAQFTRECRVCGGSGYIERLQPADAANPAYWRGVQFGCGSICERVNEILDGKDNGSGVCVHPWGGTRRRLLAAVAKIARLTETNRDLHRRVQQAESKQLAEIVRPLHDRLRDFEFSRRYARECFDKHGIDWVFGSSELARTLASLLLDENRRLGGDISKELPDVTRKAVEEERASCQAEIERLTVALHKAKAHPDYDYFVVFGGSLASQEWEQNTESDTRPPGDVWWRKKKETP